MSSSHHVPLIKLNRTIEKILPVLLIFISVIHFFYTAMSNFWVETDCSKLF